MFDVAGVDRQVDTAVVVVGLAVGAFSRGALHDVAAQGTHDQAAQGVPGRRVLPPSAGGGGRFLACAACQSWLVTRAGTVPSTMTQVDSSAGTSLDTNPAEGSWRS